MLKAFFLLGLIFVKNTAIAAEQFFPEQPLYEWLAQSQSMSESSLVSINPALINKRFVSVEKISNATPLIKYYADVLIKEGVPVEFAILPLIESGNNPQARSPKNALGLWQFMPATGRDWGLVKTVWLDERVDVQKSTLSAAQYLSSLYRKFHNWNLVLASYNWGSGSVERALKKGLLTPQGKIDLQFLPLETQGYLISFYQFNHLIKQTHQQPALNKYPNKPYLIAIPSEKLTQYLTLNPRLTSTNDWVFKHMNGFDVKSDVNKSILVPTYVFSKYFSLNKVSFKTTIPKSKEGCAGFQGQQYNVHYGDSMESVAKKYHLKVDQLLDLNPAVHFLRPGMQLIVC